MSTLHLLKKTCLEDGTDQSASAETCASCGGGSWSPAFWLNTETGVRSETLGEHDLHALIIQLPDGPSCVQLDHGSVPFELRCTPDILAAAKLTVGDRASDEDIHNAWDAFQAIQDARARVERAILENTPAGQLHHPEDVTPAPAPPDVSAAVFDGMPLADLSKEVTEARAALTTATEDEKRAAAIAEMPPADVATASEALNTGGANPSPAVAQSTSRARQQKAAK